MGQEEKLSISDWLSFLETRSSNLISVVSIGVLAVSIVISILGLSAELEWKETLIALVTVLFLLQGLVSWMVDGPIIVEILEAKRISDLITKGELDTTEEIEEAWCEREKSWLSWLDKKI